MLTSGSERLRIDNSGRVSIGSATGASAYGTKLFVEDSSAGLAIFNRAGSGGLNIGADNDGPILQPLDNADSFRIFTNSAERLRVDSSGNLLVGKTSPGVADLGFEARDDGILAVNRNNATPVYFGRKTSDGAIIEFRRDTNQFASIGVLNTNNLFIGSDDADHSGIQFGTHSITPMDRDWETL